LPARGPCLNHDPGLHIGYDRNGVYVCGAHIGDDNPKTVPGVAYDCFALPPIEVQAIAQGKAPAHVNRAHNLPLDVVPAIDHNRYKPPGAPAFFLAKSCGRASGGCQRSTNFAFDSIVNTFTRKGATGTWNAAGSQQVVKTDTGSARSKWL
jgi:hypothetical protein